MSRKNGREYGASSSFLLIGLVLVALVAGGVYFVQQRGNQDEKTTTTTSTGTSNENEQKAKPDEKPQNTNRSNDTNTQPGSSSNLPESGPTEDMLGIIISGVLAASATAYVQSVRSTRGYSKS